MHGLRPQHFNELDELPVWDLRQRIVVGMISRKQLTRRYVERMAAVRSDHGGKPV